jgi:UDP-N-acetyl-2-amino-2-deoxyglucuronate dehydrogenase
MIGTGAISHKHAAAYKSIGFRLIVCTDVNEASGRKFADQYGAQFVSTFEEVCRHPDVDYVDVCTFPDFRLQPVRACAESGKHVQVQKPIATTVATAREMIEVAAKAGIVLGVVSQHRFDDSSQFVHKAIGDGRLGRILQCDCYVKWWRSADYYSRPIKGSWDVEGGGALINQAIHQIDILRWLAGPVSTVNANWRLGAVHKIQSEDIINAMLTFQSGALGIVQAATAFWPGYSERVEIHGSKGTAIITGDKLTTWDVQNDSGDPPPLASDVASGSSDPMAISLEPFERQFLDLAHAIEHKSKPLVDGEAGLHALEIVEAAYQSCRTGQRITLS